MRRYFTLIGLAVLIFTGFEAKSQNYNTAIGLRAGYPAGITVKHFISDRSALEGIGSFWRRGARFTGLYQLHSDLGDVSGLQWYLGGGGFVEGINRIYHPAWGGSGGYLNIGISGVLGLEYTFQEFPFVLGIDWMPTVSFRRWYGYGFFEGGISFRYTF